MGARRLGGMVRALGTATVRRPARRAGTALRRPLPPGDLPRIPGRHVRVEDYVEHDGGTSRSLKVLRMTMTKTAGRIAET